MTHFFDNCISRRLVEVLRLAGFDGLVHLQDEFQPDVKDVDWMPEIAERGLMCVTADLRIRSRKEEAALRGKLGLTTYFLAHNYPRMALHEQIWRGVKLWPDVLSHKARKGACYLISVNGKIEPFS